MRIMWQTCRHWILPLSAHFWKNLIRDLKPIMSIKKMHKNFWHLFWIACTKNLIRVRKRKFQVESDFSFQETGNSKNWRVGWYWRMASSWKSKQNCHRHHGNISMHPESHCMLDDVLHWCIAYHAYRDGTWGFDHGSSHWVGHVIHSTHVPHSSHFFWCYTWSIPCASHIPCIAFCSSRYLEGRTIHGKSNYGDFWRSFTTQSKTLEFKGLCFFATFLYSSSWYSGKFKLKIEISTWKDPDVNKIEEAIEYMTLREHVEGVTDNKTQDQVTSHFDSSIISIAILIISVLNSIIRYAMHHMRCSTSVPILIAICSIFHLHLLHHISHRITFAFSMRLSWHGVGISITGDFVWEASQNFDFAFEEIFIFRKSKENFQNDWIPSQSQLEIQSLWKDCSSP